MGDINIHDVILWLGTFGPVILFVMTVIFFYCVFFLIRELYRKEQQLIKEKNDRDSKVS